jgi:hypothetical protein
MEALTYDRALALAEYIPPDEYKTWQPRQLMAALAEIDPSITRTATVASGREEEYSKPAPRRNMKVMGTDVVFTQADLKKHYDAIGSFLHMPSLDQVQSGKLPNVEKLRERCETVVQQVENVLSSRVWNVTFGSIVTLDQCVNEDCKKPIRRRMPTGKNTLTAQCFECKAEYTITSTPDGALWKPNLIDVLCETPGCPEKMVLWPHEFQPGTHWHCRGCAAHHGITLGVTKLED